MDKKNNTFSKIADSIKEEAKLQTENLSEAQKRVLSEEFIDITEEPVMKEKPKPEPIKIKIHREEPKPETKSETEPETKSETEDVDDSVEVIPEDRVLGTIVDESVMEPTTQESVPHRKHIGRIAIGVFVTLIVFIYLGGVVLFRYFYIPGTWIGSRSLDFCNKNAIIREYDNNQYPFCVVFKGTDERDLIIDSESLEAVVSYDTSELLKEQDDTIIAMEWPYYMAVGHSIEVPVRTEYKDATLTSLLRASGLFDNTGVEPTNASLTYSDGKIEIVGEKSGTILDFLKTKKAVIRALDDLTAGENTKELCLSDEGCYKEPYLKKDDQSLLDAQSRAQKIVDSKITYDWNGNEEIVDGDLIAKWLIFNDTSVTVDKSKVSDYVNEKAGLYDTYGKNLTFHTTNNIDRTIQRHGYGWKTDVDEETKALVQNIMNGEVISKEPVYAFEGYVKGMDDVGDSYVEIDLSAQHLYLYSKGELILESDFVSGGPPKGSNTPDGIYGITYKTKNAVLRGPGYETPVSFWMPYNGGVGMHDATWRSAFGGTIYQTNGSHGCVNLPYESAAFIYEQVCTNFPVVSYW